MRKKIDVSRFERRVDPRAWQVAFAEKVREVEAERAKRRPLARLRAAFSRDR